MNTDGNPTQTGACYVFDAQGNFVSTGMSCITGSSFPPVLITGDYTALTPNLFIIANCAATCTVNLPDISITEGFRIAMKNVGPANAIFHNMAGQQIDGQDDWGLLPDNSQINLISLGGQWYVY